MLEKPWQGPTEGGTLANPLFRYRALPSKDYRFQGLLMQFLSWLPEWIILGLYCPLASALLCCDGVALFLSGLPK